MTLIRPPHAQANETPEVQVDINQSDGVRFDRADFGFVGVYDVDWLTQPDFTRMLDTFAASPGAISGVRFFGAFTAGRPEQLKPESGGIVWTDPDRPIDFNPTFAALEALVSRNLTPFISLGFFPPAVSPSPIQPPASWGEWKRLVRTFLEELAADPHFGADRIGAWWFEVWNEPNEGRFWSGTQEDYFALYRATSEAVAETGLTIRLGGPAIAYKPQVSPDDGAPWMERFFRFVAADPELQLDFVSFHRKGTVTDEPPNPRLLHGAALQVRELAHDVLAGHGRGLTFINNEADEKVGFEVPYAPRMDHTGAAWLVAVTAEHAFYTSQSRAFDHRFMAAADNANLQLVQDPFDGRRSIVTVASEVRDELIKLPAFGYYELLRLMGDRQVTAGEGADQFYPRPRADLYHVCTAADSHVTSMVTYYPHPDFGPPGPRSIDYGVAGLPWERFNAALFRIDRVLSNAYTAAGGSLQNPCPVPDPADLDAIRRAQEVSVARSIATGAGSWRERLSFEPYTTLCLWITPYSETVPEPPGWIEAEQHDEHITLRWAPSVDSAFYSYEVFRLGSGAPGSRLTPFPLRAAIWVDRSPSSARQTYGVRVVSASGVASPLTQSRVAG